MSVVSNVAMLTRYGSNTAEHVVVVFQSVHAQIASDSSSARMTKIA